MATLENAAGTARRVLGAAHPTAMNIELDLRVSREALSARDVSSVNEAFAAVVLRFMQAFNVDESRVNVNGGAIAMGHPLGATGAIIIGMLLDELERSGKGTGLATLCVASGMGAATIVERI